MVGWAGLEPTTSGSQSDNLVPFSSLFYERYSIVTDGESKGLANDCLLVGRLPDNR